MTRISIDKSLIVLASIIILIVVFTLVMVTSLRTDPFIEAVKDELAINMLLIIEQDGKPLATEIFMFYPANRRGALLDIPPETGLIIRSLNRMDRIDALYDREDPVPYMKEIEKLTGAVLNWYIRIDEQSMIDLVDLLDGFPLFIPNTIKMTQGELPAFVPAGARVLDGGKIWLYLNHIEPDRPEVELVTRRQNVFQALLKQLKQKSAYVLHEDVFPYFSARMSTNLSDEALRYLYSQLADMDTERLVFQRLTGNHRVVDGIPVLFPHYDGELVRDIVKQTLNALLAEDVFVVEDKVFTLEILNGTQTRGMAQQTADIFRSFGYDVVSVANAPSQTVEKTIVISRNADSVAAETIARVIRCQNIEYESTTGSATLMADFVVVIGSDFNGRYCDN
ncbi:MAG: LCP family protein [Spirochaetes bacterium]|nr:LCP family protein [Spirochaetota bacterium]MBU0955121.1 LCP family protein [Spirochaetota bacterium]